MKHRVNKPMALLLAVMIIITMFAGCGEKETGALRICVDLSMFSPVYQPGMGNKIDGSDQQTIMELFEAEFASYLKMNNLEPIELEIEYIPEYVREGNPERDTAIARLRTEIMSGNGPDIFILGDNDRNVEPLFSIPEKI